MRDTVEFALGDTVYHRCKTDPEMGLVTGILFQPDGHVFLVTWPDFCERQHYAIELTREKGFVAHE